MDIYTAQYNYKGPDRLDISVKGNTSPGNFLAPTWDMVSDFKAGKIDSWTYSVKYFALLMSRMRIAEVSKDTRFEEIVQVHSQITLVCFCRSFTFCHRVLAARMLEEMGYGKYLGERIIT
jgi:hypothetical protein